MKIYLYLSAFLFCLLTFSCSGHKQDCKFEEEDKNPTLFFEIDFFPEGMLASRILYNPVENKGILRGAGLKGNMCIEEFVPPSEKMEGCSDGKSSHIIPLIKTIEFSLDSLQCAFVKDSLCFGEKDFVDHLKGYKPEDISFRFLISYKDKDYLDVGLYDSITEQQQSLFLLLINRVKQYSPDSAMDEYLNEIKKRICNKTIVKNN